MPVTDNDKTVDLVEELSNKWLIVLSDFEMIQLVDVLAITEDTTPEQEILINTIVSYYEDRVGK